MIARLIVCLALALSTRAAAADSADFRAVKVLDGRAEISIPTDFTLMTDDMKLRKYPSGYPPKEIYSDKDYTAYVAMKSSSGTRATLDQVLTSTATTIGQVRDVTWHDKGKRVINGREFGYLEFTAKAFDNENYNYLYFTLRDDELLLFTFNIAAEKLPVWKARFAAIVTSTRILPAP